MRPRVLVADDSAPIRRVVEAALKGVALDLVSVADSAAALAELRAAAPSLVLADLHLPDGGARGLVDHLAKRGLEVPVVVLMSPLDDFDAARGRRMGASGVFIKPFDPVALRELVARFCPEAWEGVAPNPEPPDPGSVAMERIRQEVLQVSPGLKGAEGDGASLEAAVEGEVQRLFAGDALDPRVEQILREVLRAELVRVLPQVVAQVVRERIAEIEAEALGQSKRSR